MTKINSHLIDAVSAHYSQTTKTTGPAQFILSQLRRNVGMDLMSITAAIEDISSKKRLLDLVSAFRALARVFEDEPEIADVFRALAEGAESRSPNCAEIVEDLKICTPTQFENFVSELEGTSAGIAQILWASGAKLEDLARDKFHLTKVMDGIIEIESGLGTTKARTLTSDDSFGLTPEEFDEIKGILKNTVASKDSLGLDVTSSLHRYTKNWEYTPTQLRVSHAERLLNEGMSQAEVADIQGIRPDTLRQRQRKYRNAN